MKIPVVTKEPEKYNFDALNLTQDNDTVIISEKVHTKYLKTAHGYSITISNSDSYFLIVKNYYQNNWIKEKYVTFNSGECPVGTGYYYDENGNLMHEENYDSLFKFSIEKLIDYMIESNIPIATGFINGGYEPKIFKVEESGKPVWVIKWLIEPSKMEIIKIDGMSGKIISKSYRKFSNS